MYFKSTIYFILLIGFLTSFPNSFYGQEDTALVRTFGGNGLEEGREIIACTDGGYAVVGTEVNSETGNSNVYLLRLDDQLHCVWGYSYGNIAIEKGFSIVETEDGHFMLAGYGTEIEGNGYDVLVIKIDSDGNPLWLKYFGGNDWDFANKIIAHPNGGFLIAGKTYSTGNGSSDGYLLHIDGDGNSISEWTYGTDSEDAISDVVAIDNYFYFALNSRSGENANSTIKKISFDGYPELELPIIGLDSTTIFKIYGSEDKLFVCGDFSNNGSRSGFLRSYSNENVISLEILQGAPGYFSFIDFEVTLNEIIIIGETNSYGAGGTEFIFQRRLLDGYWTAGPTFGSAYDEHPFDILVHNNKPIAIGNSNGYLNEGNQFDIVIYQLEDVDLTPSYAEEESLGNNCLTSQINDFPNPLAVQLFVSNQTLHVNKPNAVIHEIYDISGKLILLNNSAAANIESLAIGYYLCKIEIEGGSCTLPFIKN